MSVALMALTRWLADSPSALPAFKEEITKNCDCEFERLVFQLMSYLLLAFVVRNSVTVPSTQKRIYLH
jgi:hypothetical protein